MLWGHFLWKGAWVQLYVRVRVTVLEINSVLMCLSPCSSESDLTAAPPHTGTRLGSSQSSVPHLMPQKSPCPSILYCFPESSGVLPPACLNSPSPICVARHGLVVRFSQVAPWLLAPQLFEAGCAPAEHRSALTLILSLLVPKFPLLLPCSFSSCLLSMAPSLSLRQLSFRV